MKDYIITCDSTVDLSQEALKDIPYVAFPYECNGKTFVDDLGKSLPYKDFFNLIRDGKIFKTSQPSVQTYIDFFNENLKSGKDVLHVSFSSGLSGSYNSACLAADEVNENSENKVYVVDSLAASSGHGLLVYKAIDNQKEGMSIEDNINWIEDNKRKIIHWFFSSDLSSYVRGGRISKAAGFFGTALQICPVMCVSDEGKLEVIEKTRTKKKAMKRIIELMQEEVGSDYDDYCFISGSDCIEDVEAVGEMVKEAFPKVKDIKLCDIGTIIGSHSGPGTVALFYVGKKRAL